MTEIEGLRERAENINKLVRVMIDWKYGRTSLPLGEILNQELAPFAALIQQETREECAKVAEKMLNGKGIAAAIRGLQRSYGN
jgi:hypothetical protein